MEATEALDVVMEATAVLDVVLEAMDVVMEAGVMADEEINLNRNNFLNGNG
jgi:hypothetical protein